MPILDWLHLLHSPEGIQQIIASAGLIALIAIIFAETGLLIGFFLPGDSLLVIAGMLSSSSFTGEHPLLDFWTTTLSLIAAAVIGDQVGFYLGRKTGPRIFNKPDSRFFKKKYADEAHAFYEQHGGKAIIMARFVPILRTFVPYVAGIAHMNYKKFISFNIWGGIFWVFSLMCVGYFLGKSPLGEKIHLIILVVIFISIIPLIIGALKRLLKKQ